MKWGWGGDEYCGATDSFIQDDVCVNNNNNKGVKRRWQQWRERSRVIKVRFSFLLLLTPPSQHTFLEAMQQERCEIGRTDAVVFNRALESMGTRAPPAFHVVLAALLNKGRQWYEDHLQV
ncbi:hypothetical protein TRVL_04458 [Trypanosoma vivax]|nr:hypothetical protein TRVL_04458 [Trypanosoma vivax]